MFLFKYPFSKYRVFLLNMGDQAYEIVRGFSEIGIHHWDAGDRDTLRWLGSKLAFCGADVSFQTFPYHHFDAELSVWSIEKSIEAEALYYSFTGKRYLRNPATGLVDAHADDDVIFRRSIVWLPRRK